MDTFTSWPDLVAMSRRETNKALGVAFGSVVKSIRERAGYSQEGFAHEAGMDRSFWGAIERGRYNPSLGTIWRVAEALGKRPRDVIAAVEKVLPTTQIEMDNEGSEGQVSKTESELGEGGKRGMGERGEPPRHA